MTEREAFKFGFISRCVHDGVPPAQIPERIKTAIERLGQVKAAVVGAAAKGVLDTVRDWGGRALGLGIPLALAAPPIAGGLAGYGLARATDIDDTEVEDIKKKEVLEEYVRQREHLLREKATRDYARARRASGRMF